MRNTTQQLEDSVDSPPSLASSASSPENSPSLSPKDQDRPYVSKSTKLPQKCPLLKCLLCSRDQPYCLARGPTWPAIMRVVFYVLQYDRPEKDFFNLKEDVYNVMLWHWDKLSINKKSSMNWKKHIQDMLSHSKDLFESGLEIYGQNGYWRLKVDTDPWTLNGKTRRTPKKEMIAKRAREAENQLRASLGSSTDSSCEPPPAKRPFVPFIVRPGNTPNTSSLSYVFVNERAQAAQIPDPASYANKVPYSNSSPLNSSNNSITPFPTTSNPLSSSSMLSLPSLASHPSLPSSSNFPFPTSSIPFPHNKENQLYVQPSRPAHEEDGIVPQLAAKFAQFDREIRMRASPPPPVPSTESLESTFRMFASAKPCNPCPVSFLLNE